MANDIEAAGWVEHTKIIAFDWRVLRLTRGRNPGLATAHLTIPPSLAVNVKPLSDGTSPWTDGIDVASHGGSELAAIQAHGGGGVVTPISQRSRPSAWRRPRRWTFGSDLGECPLAEDISRLEVLRVFSITASGPVWGRER